MAMQTGELPGEYRRVEYLQTPGGKTYIDSGITMSEDLVFEIDFQLTEVTKSVYFMGEYFGTSFYLWISEQGSSLYFQTAFGATYKNTTLLADTDRHKFVYSFSNGEAIVKNGDDIIWNRPIVTMSTRSILVAGTSSNGIPVKTYSSKMITFVSAPEVRAFSGETLDWTLDGECMPDVNETTIRNLRSAITLYC